MVELNDINKEKKLYWRGLKILGFMDHIHYTCFANYFVITSERVEIPMPPDSLSLPPTMEACGLDNCLGREAS